MKRWVVLVMTTLAAGVGRADLLTADQAKKIVLGDSTAVIASVLVDEYSTNEFAAEQKYKGSVLIIGVVRDAKRDVLGRPVVHLEAGIAGVACVFADPPPKELAALEAGQLVAIRTGTPSSEPIGVTAKATAVVWMGLPPSSKATDDERLRLATIEKLSAMWCFLDIGLKTAGAVSSDNEAGAHKAHDGMAADLKALGATPACPLRPLGRLALLCQSGNADECAASDLQWMAKVPDKDY